jgi:uncharacterized caspase-like protein
MHKTTFALVLALLMHASSQAQTTYAVVVGISDYEIMDYKTGDLNFADADAKRFAQFLNSAAGGAVPSQNTLILTNRQASQANIKQAMEVFKRATANDRIIFYFSGHGMAQAFVPYDVRQNDYASLLTHAEVKAAFKASAASTKLIIADACLSGSMRAKQVPKLSLSAASKSFGDVNVAMILSSRSSQSSIENGQIKGGIFTFYLLVGLQGNADTNADKAVTIRELYKYIAPRIKRSTPNGQAPVFAGKFSDDLVLSRL